MKYRLFDREIRSLKSSTFRPKGRRPPLSVLFPFTDPVRTAMSTDNVGKGLLLKADPVANAFRDEIKEAIAKGAKPPKLVGILSTSSAPSKFYAEFTKKQCDELGVEFELRKTGSAADSQRADGDGVEEAIIEANEDDSIDGIMVRTFVSSTQMVLNNMYVPCEGLLPYFRGTTGL